MPVPATIDAEGTIIPFTGEGGFTGGFATTVLNIICDKAFQYIFMYIFSLKAKFLFKLKIL